MLQKLVLVLLSCSLMISCSGVEKERVYQTVNRMFISTDNQDWPAVEACFADTVFLDMTSLVGGEPVSLTPDQITAAWDDGFKGLKAVHHQTGNYMITIKGMEADVFCYGTATHYFPNASGPNTHTFVGSYDFHLVKSNNEWRIDRFKYNVKYTDGNSDLSRIARESAGN